MLGNSDIIPKKKKDGGIGQISVPEIYLAQRKQELIPKEQTALYRKKTSNQAPHLKLDRPNGKNTKSKKILKSVQNWLGELT